jgi:hypothetical protein
MDFNDPLHKVFDDEWEARVYLSRNEFPEDIPGIKMDSHGKRTILRFYPKYQEATISRKSGLLCFENKHIIYKMAVDSKQIPVLRRISKVHRGVDPITGKYIVGITTQSWRFAPIGFICMLYEAFKTEKRLNKFRLVDAYGKLIDIGSTTGQFKKNVNNAAVFQVPYTYAEKFIEESGGVFVHSDRGQPLPGLFYIQPTLYSQFEGSDLGIQMYPKDKNYSDLSDDDRNLVFASRHLFLDEEKCDYFKKITAEIQYAHRMDKCIDCCHKKKSQCQFMTGGKCPMYKCCHTRECPNAHGMLDAMSADWVKVVSKLAENPSVNSGIEKINEVFSDTANNTTELVRDGLVEFLGKELLKSVLDMIGPFSNMEELQVEFITAYFRQATLAAFSAFADKWHGKIRNEMFLEFRECLLEGQDSIKFMRDMKVNYYRAMVFIRMESVFNYTIDSWNREHGIPVKRRVELTDTEVKKSFLIAPAKTPKKVKKKSKKRK